MSIRVPYADVFDVVFAPHAHHAGVQGILLRNPMSSVSRGFGTHTLIKFDLGHKLIINLVFGVHDHEYS